ncbi:MAG: class I SAM-dependent methyltransferase [Candidatus Gastranaerophilales bacterium]|nr:class I SAM-dependent methyltransferase [Candidatus Gastranaerophilales bacterium]
MPRERDCGVSEAYSDFAQVYDIFMDETPYGQWCERIAETIEKYGVSRPGRAAEDALGTERDLVVDLGCGTGALTELLYQKGYDMIGVDHSASMLNVAMNKKAASGADIWYLNQDMRELELYSTVGTVVSVCDVLNYILEEDELLQIFSLVNNYLYPGGIFIFDFNTDYKYREVIGDATIAENREECSFIWENFYDEESGVNEYDVTVFVRERDELFKRFAETHFQRGYSAEQMKRLAERAGMQIVEILDADTGGTVTKESERIYMVVREHGKND